MKSFVLLLIAFVVLFFVVWFLIDWYAVNTVLKTGNNCGEESANTPAHWVVAGEGRTLEEAAFHAAPWFIADYQTVSFPSRQKNTTISAWWMPTTPDQPAVIVVHGIGADSGKCNANSLLPAAMLFKAGFNVLNIDLSGYNQSSHHGRYLHLGQTEYLDVLGAVDWLNDAQHIPTRNMALYGYSLGAFTAALAFAEDPQLAGLWMDTPFINFKQQAADEFKRLGLPKWLSWGVVPIANRLTGVNLIAKNGVKLALSKDHQRPIFLTQAEGDPRIAITQGREILALAQQDHANIQHWFVPGVDVHVAAMLFETKAYQQRLLEFFDSVFS